MLWYFAGLTAAALVLLFNNPLSRINRWAAGFLGIAGLGGLAFVLKDWAASPFGPGEAGDPYGTASGEGNLPLQAIRTAASALELLNQLGTPYACAVFAAVYSGLFSRRTENRMAAGLLLPAGLTAAFTAYSPELVIPYGLLLAWAGPAYLFSCLVLFLAYRRERHPGRRRSRLVTFLIMAPTLLLILALINIGRTLDPAFDFFPWISLAVGYSFAAAAVCLFLYGVLGVKLRFVRDPWDSTMKAVASGTAIVNHTIKNEIAKISLSTDNLQPLAGPEAEESLRIIRRSADHMLAMVTRMHGQMQETVLVEEPCRLTGLLEEALEPFGPLFGACGIRVERRYLADVTVCCDHVHLREALGNLLRNAAEAMKKGGVLTVELECTRRWVRLTIRDTGPGIPRDALPYVFEPFYTTKGQGENFGLGLAYSYNVIRKSGGSLKLDSPPGGGTTADILLPARKIVKPEEGVADKERETPERGR
ncbi:HAMP domain-containing sensor histidine kinase [Paenibacillus aurantius]|uniref:histidine kinase n=1 Tax=Paenibacillus aurantius TaxID=2918900 RepID=A0AA96LCP4_9BACL|nr:HAMP domain-containing sensor histidine kinase [Paenibacillus aurantius]WNQ10763.1 HAMP domain-containing sensor histidine kinase [Paenibacillus aurantius]